MLLGDWEMGEKKEFMHSCPLAFRCASNSIGAKCNFCLSCLNPALTVADYGCHPGSTELLGPEAVVVAKFFQGSVLVEATSVSAFKFPY